jgi:hypothetical protein
MYILTHLHIANHTQPQPLTLTQKPTLTHSFHTLTTHSCMHTLAYCHTHIYADTLSLFNTATWKTHTLTLTFTLPHDHAIKYTNIYTHTHTQSLSCNHAHCCSHTHFYTHTQSLSCTPAHSHTVTHKLLTVIVTPSCNNTLTIKFVHTHSQVSSPKSDPHFTSICGLAGTDLTASQPITEHRCHIWQPFKSPVLLS